MASPPWRGGFLDGAALAAQVLGRADFTKRLEAAWLGAPSLLRLLRFLAAGDPAPATMKKRGAAALSARSTNSPRLLGVLHVVVGELPEAAEHLQKAAGLGWSSPDRPGHVLFPTFAWLLGGAPSGTVRGRIAETIHRPPTFDLEFDVGALDAEAPEHAAKPAEPRLPAPTLVQVLLRVRAHESLSATDRSTMLTAMKAAAAARVAGVLGEKRRRHYEHAALLAACCAEFEGAGPKAAEASLWVAGIRQTWYRFPAFQQALRAALAREGVGRQARPARRRLPDLEAGGLGTSHRGGLSRAGRQDVGPSPFIPLDKRDRWGRLATDGGVFADEASKAGHGSRSRRTHESLEGELRRDLRARRRRVGAVVRLGTHGWRRRGGGHPRRHSGDSFWTYVRNVGLFMAPWITIGATTPRSPSAISIVRFGSGLPGAWP